MAAFLWIALGGIVLTAGDIIFKFWIKQPQPWLYGIGLLVYLGGLICLIESFKTQHIAVASIAFIVVNIVSLSLVSWLYFDEQLTALQIAGIGLALAAIAMLELGG